MNMRFSGNDIEQKAKCFRIRMGLNTSEAIDVKTILRKNNILTVYLPMSKDACGLSLQSPEKDKFILVNSNISKGRQHFTIAHELYHLYYDESPHPHICFKDGISNTERAANCFASALLMPAEGVIGLIPDPILREKNLPLSIVLRLEQYFRVSRSALLYRLKELKLIGEIKLQEYLSLPVTQTAVEYGYDTTLYLPGNENLVIGDYGEKARLLYENDLISEGHYEELLNKIQDGKEENSFRC